jgi:hypothetical protein
MDLVRCPNQALLVVSAVDILLGWESGQAGQSHVQTSVGIIRDSSDVINRGGFIGAFAFYFIVLYYAK